MQQTLAEGFLDNFIRKNITGEITDSLQNPALTQQQRVQIQTLENSYRQKADTCEADLVLSRQHQNYNEIQSLRLVSDINDALGANLYEYGFVPFDGKRVDYSKYDCDNIKAREGLADMNHTIIAGNRWAGLVRMCNEHERLKNCFLSIEDVMRENNLGTSDLGRPEYYKMPGFDTEFIQQDFLNSTMSQ